MIDQIIITIIAFIALFMSLSRSGKYEQFITILLAIPAGLMWIPIPIATTLMLVSLLLGTVLAGVYGVMNEKLSLFDRIAIISLAVFVLLSNSAGLLHLPGAFTYGIMMAVPFVIFLVWLAVNKFRVTDPLPFMLILAVHCFIEVFDALQLWS